MAVGLDAEESTADWEVYVSGGLGISGSIVDTDGTVPGTPILTLSREDGDASPLVDGALGLRIPMDELGPRDPFSTSSVSVGSRGFGNGSSLVRSISGRGLGSVPSNSKARIMS